MCCSEGSFVGCDTLGKFNYVKKKLRQFVIEIQLIGDGAHTRITPYPDELLEKMALAGVLDQVSHNLSDEAMGEMMECEGTA